MSQNAGERMRLGDMASASSSTPADLVDSCEISCMCPGRDGQTSAARYSEKSVRSSESTVCESSPELSLENMRSTRLARQSRNKEKFCDLRLSSMFSMRLAAMGDILLPMGVCSKRKRYA